MQNYLNDHDSSAHSMSGFTAGLLCGAAVGAALGLLFAPRAGRELREDLSNTASRLKQRAGEKYDQAAGAAADLAAKGRDFVTSTSRDLADASRQVHESYATARNDARTDL